ncbi:MAG: hypothetical protein SGI98_08770 [Verrucomicrobiota bacterium]|nr:hypothetical protein [Verrucomicrobiota bacterium]
MSDAHYHQPQPEKVQLADYFLPMVVCMIIGVACLVVAFGSTAIGMFTWKEISVSWLFACSIGTLLCFGSFFWVLLQHVTNSGWGISIRRIPELIAGNIFIMGLLFLVPMAFLAPNIYKWMNLNSHDDHLLHWKHGFLNEPFFWTRAVFYFVAIGTLAFLFKRLSTKQDKTGDDRLSLKLRHISYLAVPLFALTMTFWSFDWLMGLNFHWYSTMWGVYVFASSAGASMALLILIITGLRSMGYMKEVISDEHYHLMGKLLFAFTVFWAYIAFSQYMLIWYANIPEETIFFRNRSSGGWWWYAVILFAPCKFAVPFVLLLTQWIKKKPQYLCLISGWVILMFILEIYWIIMPEFRGNRIMPSILDILSIVAVFGILSAGFLRSLGKYNIFPLFDPRLKESVTVKN